MSITNNDICKILSEKDGGDWRICFDDQARVFFYDKEKRKSWICCAD